MIKACNLTSHPYNTDIAPGLCATIAEALREWN